MKKRLRVAAVIACVAILSYCADNRPNLTLSEKPVIYLYPEQMQEITVKLDYNGRLTDTIPAYKNGWKVTAWPDGRLRNQSDGQEYPYLFWEGEDRTKYDMSKGFVIPGNETETFLRKKLALMGLIPKEYEEFIQYWMPRMKKNPYNLITFQTDAYEVTAGLSISPQPDSLLRVFMVYTPLSHPVQVEESVTVPFERKGFTVVEWGGKGILGQ